jgi:hypothetical protein
VIAWVRQLGRADVGKTVLVVWRLSGDNTWTSWHGQISRVGGKSCSVEWLGEASSKFESCSIPHSELPVEYDELRLIDSTVQTQVQTAPLAQEELRCRKAIIGSYRTELEAIIHWSNDIMMKQEAARHNATPTTSEQTQACTAIDKATPSKRDMDIVVLLPRPHTPPPTPPPRPSSRPATPPPPGTKPAVRPASRPPTPPPPTVGDPVGRQTLGPEAPPVPEDGSAPVVSLLDRAQECQRLLHSPIATRRWVEPWNRVRIQVATRAAFAGYRRCTTAEGKADKIFALLRVPKSSLVASHKDRAPPACPRQTMDRGPLEPQEKRACGLARQGYLGKAARALAAGMCLFGRSEDVVDKLAALHPSGPAPPPLPPSLHPIVELSVEEMRKLIARSCHGTAPGPSGWTEELLSAVVQDDDLAADIAALTVDIACNTVHRYARRLLTTSRLLPLPKPDGGVRPIACGEIFPKLASLAVLGSNAFPSDDLQFGVAFPAGAEIIAHSARQAVLDGHAVLTLDCRNAFNTPLRAHIAQCLTNDKRHEPFYHLFAFEYCEASSLVVQTASGPQVILSSRGTRQGTTLGPYFFAAAIHPVLRRLRLRHPRVRAMAYLDDITAWGTEADLHAFYLEARDLLADAGVSLNPSKCELLPAGVAHPPLHSEVSVLHGGIKVLGTWIGASTEDTAKWLGKKMAKHQPLFDSLPRLPSNIAVPILTKCALPRLGFFLRTHGPEATIPVAHIFDQCVIGTLTAILGHAISSLSILLARLPVRYGGLGLTSQEAIAQFAWNASRALLTHEVTPSQEAATEAMHESIYKELCAQDPITARHLQLQSRSESSLWLDAVGENKAVSYTWFLRARILAPPAAWSSLNCCPGCKKTFSAVDMLWHGPACVSIRGINTRHAHDNVVRQLRTCAERSMCRTEIEPSIYPGQPQGDVRPDLRLFAPWMLAVPDMPVALVSSVCLDVTILHVMCPSSRSSGIDTIAANRSNAKKTKYSDICASSCYQGVAKEPEAFAPFPVFSSGACCPSSRSFLAELASTDECPFTLRELLTVVSSATANGIGAVLGHISAVLARRTVNAS